MSKAYQEAVLRGKEKTFGQFIWDSEEKAFLGRTFTSWVKIIIFYNIYYAFLAGFFGICMLVFYQTLDTNMPKYTGEYSILRHPSLGFRPMPGRWEPELDVIRYNADSPGEVKHWEDELTSFIQSYELESSQGNKHNYKDCSDGNQADPKLGDDEVCLFDFKALGTNCTKENGWGYASRSPCVILKMNKMIGWEPVVYNATEELPDPMPADLKDHINQKAADNGGRIKPMVWVSCIQTMADGKLLNEIGEIKYSPSRGFPAYFFPYMNIPGYLPPIVAIEFTAPPLNRRINVECRAWAENILHNKKKSLGLVRFSLEINTDI